MATKRQRVLSVLEQSARSIQDLHAPALTRIIPVLRAAHTEIEQDLMDWLGRQNGAATFTVQRYRNALVQLRHAWKSARALAPTVNEALWEVAEDAAEKSAKNLVRELESFGRIFSGTVQPVSLDVAAIIANGEDMLIDRFASSAARYAGSVRDNVIRELAIGRARSESIFETTNRMQSRLPELFQADRWSAERLARSEVIHAYSTFHVEGLKEMNADDADIVARWDASFDWRRCPMCASLDGQVRNVAKGEKFHAEWVTLSKKGAHRHTKQLKQPPAHPCCRCCLTPWREDWGEIQTRTPKAPKILT